MSNIGLIKYENIKTQQPKTQTKKIPSPMNSTHKQKLGRSADLTAKRNLKLVNVPKMKWDAH